MKKRIAIALLFVMVGMVALPSVVHAAVPQPETIQINQVQVFRNTLELNDQLYLISHTIDYADSGIQVEYLTPNGAGDYTNISNVVGAATHWEAVDDPVAAPDDNTTYVNTQSLSEEKDAYALLNTSISADAIIARVIVFYRFATDNAASYAYCTPSLRLGTDESLGSQVFKNAVTYGTYSEELDRPGGGNWAVSDLDDLQVVAGISIDNVANQARLTQMYVKVEYTLNLPPVNDAYLVRLMDGAVELGAKAPFPYSTLGYEEGLTSIYFSAADVLAAGMGWGPVTGYTIKLQGNPALTWVGGAAPSTETSAFVLWFDDGTVGGTEERMTISLRLLAMQLENAWGVDLIESFTGVLKLTVAGEYYFEEVIDNLRDICPDLFSTLVSPAEFEQWSGTIVGEYYTGGNDAVSTLDNTDWGAQTFTAASAYSINGVWLRLSQSNAPGIVTVSIRLTAAGLPTGLDLALGTFDGSTLATYTVLPDGEWLHIPFATNYAMTQGVVYAIVVRSAAASVNWAVDTAGVYAAGQACTSGNAGVNWAFLGGGAWDFMFSNTGAEAHSMSYAKQLEGRLIGTKFDMTNLGTAIGVPRIWVSTIVWFVISFAMCFIVGKYTDSYKPTTLIMFGMMPAGAYAGFIPIIVAIIAAFFAGSMVVYIFFYRGAHA